MISKNNQFESYNFKIPTFKTNIIPLDVVLRGGIRAGEVIQIVAEPGLGKSTIACQIASMYTNEDKKVLYIDAEGSISIELLQSKGLYEEVDKNFFYAREARFSKVEEIIDSFIQEGSLDLIIIDSIACLIPEKLAKVEKGISITTNNTNYTSRQLTMFFNKYNCIVKSKQISLLVINQYRNKVDMNVGTILKEYGGKNTKYNSDVILRISTIKATGTNKKFLQLKKTIAGKELEFEVIKSNRLRPGFTIPFYLIYGHGISIAYAIIYALLRTNYIEETNHYFKLRNSVSNYKKEKEIFHGIDLLYAFIKEGNISHEFEEVVIDYYNSLNQ